MVDKVAIFFLAGHETNASALAWALYMLAIFPDAQERVAAEVADLPENPSFSDISKLKFTRDVFRETLRLYPPVPMMVREAARALTGYRLNGDGELVLDPRRHDPGLKTILRRRRASAFKAQLR